MLGSLILYFKGMRLMMFQLSGFYCRLLDAGGKCSVWSYGSLCFALLHVQLDFDILKPDC